MALPEYVTLTQLRDTLTGTAGIGARTAGDGTDAQLQDALDEAHGEVLGKLATRYTLPTDPALVPPLVRSLIVTVAGYVATLEWLQGKDLSDRDPVVLRYARAQAMLRSIVDGSTEVDGLETPVGAAVEVETFDGVPAMGLADTVLGRPVPGGPFPSYLPDSVFGEPIPWA